MKYDYNAAYDFDRFAPRGSTAPNVAPAKKAVIKELPVARQNASYMNQVLVRVGVVVMVLFMVCFNIYTRVEINDAKSKIDTVNKEILVAKSELTRLNVEFEKAISFTNLEKSALALGMQKRAKTQVHYIDTSKSDWSQVLSD